MMTRVLVLSIVAAAAGCVDLPADVDGGPAIDAAVDVDLPETSITAGPPAITNHVAARFELAASEPARFRCRVDEGPLRECTTPWDVTGLRDGDHRFEAIAIDLAGNADATPAAHSWRVDTEPPETRIDEAPPPVDNSVDVRFTFSSSTDVDAVFQCQLDDRGLVPCTSPFTATNLADEFHTFKVRAQDPAGNVDPTPETRTWEIDSVAPDTHIDDGPPALVASNTATVRFSSPNGGVGATFDCRLDAGPFSPCTSPRTLVGLADGPHAFEARVTDHLGNQDPTPARRTWTVDTTGPITSITTAPENPSADVTPTFAFAASEAGTFECQIDGELAYAPCTSPYTASALPPGSRTFRVRATDAVGNRGREATYDWLIDVTAPTILIAGGPAGTTTSATVTFQWTASEPATFCYRFAGDAADTCTMTLAAAGSVTRAGLAQGAQTFTVTATDALGNRGAPVMRDFTVDSVGPAVAITAGPLNSVGTIANAFTFASPEPATFCHAVDGGGEVCTALPGALTATVTVNAGDGTHTLTVVARDSLGNRSALPAARTWTVDTVRPTTTIASAPPPGATVDSGSATVALAASEPSTICWKLGAGLETCSAPGTMSLQANLVGLPDGVVAFSARAADAVGAGAPVTRSWIVDTARPVVMITAGPAQGSTAGSADVAFTIVASEPSTICWRFDNGAPQCSPAGSTVAYPSRSGLADGAHTFTVAAADRIGEGLALDRSWTVDSVRPTVTIASGPASGSTSGNNVASFMLAASEPATICWRFGGGAESCSAAGVLTATATSAALPDGGSLFVVYARDLFGPGAPASRAWTIDTARPTLTIVGGPAQGSISDSAAATFSVTSSEPATICWQWNNGAPTCTAAVQTTASASTGTLPAGNATFSVTAADAVGTGPAATRGWTIDLTRPSVTITAGPAQNAVVNATATQFTATTVEPARICWSLDGGALQCSGLAVMAVDIPLQSLSQGGHVLAIGATDAVGAGPVTTRGFTVDTVRPTVTVTGGPAEGSTIGSTAPAFTLASSEASTICWRFNGAAFTCSGAGQSTATATAAGLPAGAATFDVKASDAVGDGAIATVHFTIDTVRPTVAITAGPAQGSTSGSPFATFAVSASEPSTFCWRFDTGPLACSAGGLANVAITSTPLAGGNHVLSVYGADAVGPGTAIVRTWIVDAVRPAMIINSGPAEGEIIDRNDPTFQFSASEPSTICWQWNGGAPICSPPDQLGGSAHVVGLPEGHNTFSVSGADVIGAGAPTVRHFVVDTLAPVVTISSPPAEGSTTTATTASFTITSNEPATICWKLDGGASVCSAPGVLSFSANLVNVPAGVHTLAVTATDVVQHATVATRTWTRA